MTSLLLLILAHVLGDFPFQSGQVLEQKGGNRRGGYLKHGLIHLLLLIVLTHPFFSGQLLLLWVLIPLFHVLLDLGKNLILSTKKHLFLPAFSLDQFLHLILIFILWQWFRLEACPSILDFYSSLLTPAGKELTEQIFMGFNLDHFLLAAIVYLYTLLGGSVLVRGVLDLKYLTLPESQAGGEETRQAGRYIGILERAIILTLVMAGAFTSIAFILAAKSVARYKELEKKDFAEYYIVGTLLSTLIAIVGGLVLYYFFSVIR